MKGIRKQFVVIGLGNFGYYLATHLYERGHDVVAIDTDPHQIQRIKESVSQAIVADATDREVMERLGIDQVDAAIVAIGSDMSHSILASLILKDLGIKNVLAKATSESHGRILEKLGVSEVLFPEKDLAISVAERLHNPNLLDYLPFMEDHSIIQLAPPKEFIGKSLRELDLINRFGVQVIAVKELIPERLNMVPTGHFVIKDSDVLIVLGPNEALDRLREKKG